MRWSTDPRRGLTDEFDQRPICGMNGRLLVGMAASQMDVQQSWAEASDVIGGARRGLPARLASSPSPVWATAMRLVFEFAASCTVCWARVTPVVMPDAEVVLLVAVPAAGVGRASEDDPRFTRPGVIQNARGLIGAVRVF